MLVPAHPHPCQHLILVSLILAILIDVWWYFIVFFYLHFSETADVEYFSMCLFAICVCFFFFFLVKCVEIICLFELFSYYCILRAVRILDVGVISDTCFAHLCSQSVFILLIVSFEEQKLLVLMKSNLSFFFF